jgi:hypothetical protein
MQSSIGKIKKKQIAWHLRVKLIIEAATGGKMPDLIKKKIDHRLYCHHYHFTIVSLYVGHWSNNNKKKKRNTKEALSINNDINLREEKKSILYSKKMAYVNKTRWNVRACVRACIYARVLMIIKFLATDPVVQHANITQLIVIKKEHRLIKSRRKAGCI